jgi:hypothetical protein
MDCKPWLHRQEIFILLPSECIDFRETHAEKASLSFRQWKLQKKSNGKKLIRELVQYIFPPYSSENFVSGCSSSLIKKKRTEGNLFGM